MSPSRSVLWSRVSLARGVWFHPRSVSTTVTVTTVTPWYESVTSTANKQQQQHTPTIEDLRLLLSKEESDAIYHDWVYSMAHAQPTNDNDDDHLLEEFSSHPSYMAQQLQHALDHSLHNNNNNNSTTDDTTLKARLPKVVLPTTLSQALECRTQAVVVTSTKPPFLITHVNDAWSDLCGYSYRQAKGCTIGHLLHGPETDCRKSTQLINALQTGQPQATMEVLNYTRSQQPFVNRITVGPLWNDCYHHHPERNTVVSVNNHHNHNHPTDLPFSDPSYYVGILQKVG